MNIVSFWQQQIDKWNTDQKCGFCWEFGAPLIESAVTLQQNTAGKECCVKVFLVRDKVVAFDTTRTYNNQTALIESITCNKRFQLLVLLPSDMGLNNYNEIKGHPTSESVWATIMYDLENCLSCDAEIDFCAILGRQYKITQWSAVQVMNYTDSVYCGYRVSVTFQDVV